MEVVEVRSPEVQVSAGLRSFWSFRGPVSLPSPVSRATCTPGSGPPPGITPTSCFHRHVSYQSSWTSSLPLVGPGPTRHARRSPRLRLLHVSTPAEPLLVGKEPVHRAWGLGRGHLGRNIIPSPTCPLQSQGPQQTPRPCLMSPGPGSASASWRGRTPPKSGGGGGGASTW